MRTVTIEEQLRALADTVRLRIVRLLSLPARSRSAPGAGYCACDIGAVMGVSQPTISHHMKILMAAGLVDGEKSGRWVYYRIRPGAFAELANCFIRFDVTSASSAAPGESGPAIADEDRDENTDAVTAGGDAPVPSSESLPKKRLTVVSRRR